MGWSDVYLIPDASSAAAGQPLADPRRYAERAAQVLTGMRVIDGPYDDDEGWYAAGDASLAPFDREEVSADDYPEGVVAVDDLGFEACIIYGKPDLTLVPLGEECQPQCPRCGEDVGEAYFTLVEAIVDREPSAPSFAEARVACPACGGSFRFNELRDALGSGIFLVNRYVNFHESVPRVRPEWLATFNGAMGVVHTAHVYGAT